LRRRAQTRWHADARFGRIPISGCSAAAIALAIGTPGAPQKSGPSTPCPSFIGPYDPDRHSIRSRGIVIAFAQGCIDPCAIPRLGGERDRRLWAWPEPYSLTWDMRLSHPGLDDVTRCRSHRLFFPCHPSERLVSPQDVHPQCAGRAAGARSCERVQPELILGPPMMTKVCGYFTVAARGFILPERRFRGGADHGGLRSDFARACD